jgi:hypothetical protein
VRSEETQGIGEEEEEREECDGKRRSDKVAEKSDWHLI